MAVDQEMAARLRWARESAGFGTAADAIRAFDWPGVYNQHENGIRGFARHIRKYAHAYRVREEWLRYGVGLPRATTRSIVIGGVVGQYGIIMDEETAPLVSGETLSVDEPPGGAGEYTAYRVVGDLNYPALFNGDIVYAAKPTHPSRVLGRQCVATLTDGTKRLCILAPSAIAGLFMLLSINASPITDADVREAAPVIWIKRG